MQFEDIDPDEFSVEKRLERLENAMIEVIFNVKCIMGLIPLKYKKPYPKEGENPFFSSAEIHADVPSPKDYSDAKDRMEKLLEIAKIKTEKKDPSKYQDDPTFKALKEYADMKDELSKFKDLGRP